MKKYPRLLQRVFGEPWNIQPSVLKSFQTALIQHAQGKMPAADSMTPPSSTGNDSIVQNFGHGVVGIWVDGPIGKGLSSMEMMCGGGCDLNQVNEAIEYVMNDPLIKSVIMIFNTPGGTVTGLFETAARIKALCEVKDTVAYCEDLCASAGYYLASQCSYIYVTHSCTIGCIGTVWAWIDYTDQMKMDGEKAIIFQSGTLKTAGYDGKDMTQEEYAMFDSTVQKCGAEFRSIVLASRPGIADSTMQGQCFDGTDAVTLKLADQVVLDISEVMDDLI